MDGRIRRKDKRTSQHVASVTGHAESSYLACPKDMNTMNTEKALIPDRLDRIQIADRIDDDWSTATTAWVAIRDSQDISDKSASLPGLIAHNPKMAIEVLRDLIHQAKVSLAWTTRLDEILAEGQALLDRPVCEYARDCGKERWCQLKMKCCDDCASTIGGGQ